MTHTGPTQAQVLPALLTSRPGPLQQCGHLGFYDKALRVRNTFIDVAAAARRSPSLERFYREREVSTCPSSQVGCLRDLFKEPACAVAVAEGDAASPDGVGALTPVQAPGEVISLSEALPESGEETGADEVGDVSALPTYLPSVLTLPATAPGQVFPTHAHIVALPAGIDWRQLQGPRHTLLPPPVDTRSLVAANTAPQGMPAGPAVCTKGEQAPGQLVLPGAPVGAGTAVAVGMQPRTPGQLPPVAPLLPPGTAPAPAQPAPVVLPPSNQPAAPAAPARPAKLLPEGRSLPVGELPSQGSAGHATGRCKPCAFVHTAGCENGQACQFCHLCEPGEKKRRRKMKLEIRRAAAKLRLEMRRPRVKAAM